MTIKNLTGSGIWLPPLVNGIASGVPATLDSILDADEEEFQVIGDVTIDGGGSKTFGTTGSKIDWLPGASITFASSATLRVGVKKAASIDTANGPPARATIGAAAFDVYKDLIGGTDAITSTTSRSDAMAAGTPFTVTDGDQIAICFHIDIISGTQSVKIRNLATSSAMGYPASTLVTAGPAYSGQACLPNIILTFDDGTLGWITPSCPFSVLDTSSSTIGNGNIRGNIFRVPFPCKISSIAAVMNVQGNYAMELYSTPLGTPSLIESIPVNFRQVGGTSNRMHIKRLMTPRLLSANTDYAIGIKQTTATAQTISQRDINVAAQFESWGLGAECYGATSTAGGTFSPDNSGLRRYAIHTMISALDDGAGGGGAAGMKQSFMNANFSG
ncbi:hypothetical protein EBAPG3_008750 [Nitrosospira lacus]|uniref:Uncharacterized protein n=1 Tax=Nitrosospira lacus TaxID=1288494 RepID=A0A1W6SPX3_9PROT|nr:hypothetical protein [Nitrosospira lacus]ARO87846.1 hypothetical protein EBAPG3_008750 [Nitrosospira lacus]